MTQAINQWQVGNVKVTRIVEIESMFSPDRMLAGLTTDRVNAVSWLHPYYANPDGTIRISVHTFVIESQGRRILVDTCVGNHKERSFGVWNRLNLPFLERLTAAGFPPETVDTVVCTHTHMDHVGWNTRLIHDKWVPTFTNARYLFGREEWEHSSETETDSGDAASTTVAMPRRMDPVLLDSVMPIIQAGLHHFVESNYRVTDEVFLFPTPGHTLGHVSVAIESDGRKAVITGDIFHSPIQIGDPNICSRFDDDFDLARATRTAFVHDNADRDVLIFGSHFGAPSAGRIVRDGDAWRFDPAGAEDSPTDATSK